MDKITYKCPSCGSEEISAESSARWDKAQQTWVMSDVHDAITCQDCGHDSNFGTSFEVALEGV
jgi:hypothetical protein